MRKLTAKDIEANLTSLNTFVKLGEIYQVVSSFTAYDSPKNIDQQWSNKQATLVEAKTVMFVVGAPFISNANNIHYANIEFLSEQSKRFLILGLHPDPYECMYFLKSIVNKVS